MSGGRGRGEEEGTGGQTRAREEAQFGGKPFLFRLRLAHSHPNWCSACPAIGQPAAPPACASSSSSSRQQLDDPAGSPAPRLAPPSSAAPAQAATVLDLTHSSSGPAVAGVVVVLPPPPPLPPPPAPAAPHARQHGRSSAVGQGPAPCSQQGPFTGTSGRRNVLEHLDARLP